MNRGTTERSSFEFGSSLTDSCVNEENRAINHGTVESGLSPQTGQNEDCCNKEMNHKHCQINALYSLQETDQSGEA